MGLSAALGNARLAKLALFLTLARVAHQGSRLSAVRWANNHAVAEVLRVSGFDEDDLYAALDDLHVRQESIEQALYQRYLRRRGSPPTLFLYDVTSSYLEGQHNALGDFGYNRDGKLSNTCTVEIHSSAAIGRSTTRLPRNRTESTAKEEKTQRLCAGVPASGFSEKLRHGRRVVAAVGA